MNQTTPNLPTETPRVSYRACENCGKPLEYIPVDAPHKRFCGPSCRNHWNYLNKTRAKRQLIREELQHDHRER